jgi:excinuclease ABC subunit B
MASLFHLRSPFPPAGDQPKAIKQLTENLRQNAKEQVLLGVTGSGKTFTLANVIAHTQKPALIISHNKVLAAQLYQEFKDFFPNNAVHYFVSYYDYFQPEAYIPQTDTYIEKDAKINEQIDRMRHAAVQDILNRNDVIVVASVSCIYNLGSPEEYQNIALEISQDQRIRRQDFLRQLTNLQYQRNDINFAPGSFRVRGETVQVYLASGEKIIQIEFGDNQITQIRVKSDKPMAKENAAPVFSLLKNIKIFPAKFWISPEQKLKIALANIQKDLQKRVQELTKQNKLLEAQRLTQRTNYDLEMIRETGYCHGIENYSRYFEFREPGSAPFTLLDYFIGSGKNNFLTIIDESHITIPQLNAMYNTDKARKNILIEYGFRLPSCLDNRPLKFEEFTEKINQVIYVSATPGRYERKRIQQTSLPVLVEQLIRPTGLLEPTIEIRKTENQVYDLTQEIKKNALGGGRTLVITLTKRLAEELTAYLKEQGIKVQYLHSEIKTLQRPDILNKLRQGEYEAIVGINLLREGLDLPEVSLVAILDADKEGFLRNETTLIQTIGRASRHINGRAILYADTLTTSIKNTIREIKRRRTIQQKYNQTHHITPSPIAKQIKQWNLAEKASATQQEFAPVQNIELLKEEMKKAAQNLDFERAIVLRDMIQQLKNRGA